MTYFGFLALFLGIPIAALSAWAFYSIRRGKWLPPSLHTNRVWGGVVGLCLVAFLYTTPWDNYLVATRVWWYDINLVSGIVFGWVPIEEYTFFILQPILGCLLFYALASYLPVGRDVKHKNRVRYMATGVVAIFWLFTVILLGLTFSVETYKPATYLVLELSWALIPIILQLGFGADIIWRHRWPVLATIIVMTLYLSWADSIAIGSGTWTIDPEQSLNVFLGGVLPIEEFVFFLLTNILIAFGITIIIADESLSRVQNIKQLQPVLRLFPLKQKV